MKAERKLMIPSLEKGKCGKRLIKEAQGEAQEQEDQRVLLKIIGKKDFGSAIFLKS